MKRALTLIAVSALPLLAACGGSHPKPAASPAAHSASPAALSHAAADCAKLSAAAFPPAAYDQLVTREVGRLASGGDASATQIRKAKAVIGREIQAACPQFADLPKGS